MVFKFHDGTLRSLCASLSIYSVFPKLFSYRLYTSTSYNSWHEDTRKRSNRVEGRKVVVLAGKRFLQTWLEEAVTQHCAPSKTLMKSQGVGCVG